MRMGTVLGFVAALATSPAAMAQANPSTFKPASAWAVDYGDDYCRLARTFGSGDKQLTLVLERIQPGPAVRMMLAGEGITTSPRAARLGFSFTPARENREARVLRAENADGGSIYNLGTVYLAEVSDSTTREDRRNLRLRYSREAEAAYAGSIDGVLVDGGVTEPVWLETGELGAPVAALQACTDELIEYWGVDAASHRTLSRPVVPASEMASWIPADTIPRSEFRLLAGSQNVVRVMVDASGAPSDCAIHFPSLAPALNEAVCASMMENARFEPARDASGAPIASYWITELGLLAGPRPGG